MHLYHPKNNRKAIYSHYKFAYQENKNELQLQKFGRDGINSSLCNI